MGDVLGPIWRDWAEADIGISLAGVGLPRLPPQITINTLKKAETIEVNSNGMIDVRNLILERLRSGLAIRLRNKEIVAIMVETQNGYKSLCNVTKSEMKDGKLVISLSTDDNNLTPAPAGAYKSAKLTFYSHGEKNVPGFYEPVRFATWNKSNSQLTVNKADQLPGTPFAEQVSRPPWWFDSWFDASSVGRNLLILAKDGNGNTNKMVARVKGVTSDNKITKFELTTKGFVSSGKAATNAVSGFASGEYHGLNFFQYEEPCESQDCPNRKTAALSVSGTITKVNNADGTFQVGFTVKEKARALLLYGFDVASENAKIFLPKLSKDLEADALAQVTLLGTRRNLLGYMTGLKQSKDLWTATFECDYGYDTYMEGTKIGEIVLWFSAAAPREAGVI